MKKTLSTLVCALLIAVSVFISVDTEKVTFGAGNGVNKKIESVEEVSNLLQSFLEKDYGAKLTSNDDKNDETSKEKYTSATIEFTTKAGVDANYNIEGYGRIVQHVTMDRKMTCYFTENSAYYKTEAFIKSSSGEGDKEVTQMIKLNGEVFFCDVTYIRINEFVTSSIDNMPDMSQTYGKWFELSREYTNQLMDVNKMNYAIMAMIGEYVEDKDKFNKSGSVYNLKEQYFKELFGDMSSTLGANINAYKNGLFKLDLTEKTKPKISLYYKETNSNIMIAEYLDMKISNVNNTIAEFPKDVTIYSQEDFENYVNE